MGNAEEKWRAFSGADENVRLRNVWFPQWRRCQPRHHD